MAIVYKHIRLDNNEVFYVGIGKESSRAYSKSDRNKYWHNIVNKTKYSIEIFKENISWIESCEIEKQLILKYGRKDLRTGSLVNMTSGGDGSLGLIHTQETKDKISKSKKGHNNYNFGKKVSKEVRKKMSKSKLGSKNPLYKIEKTKHPMFGKKQSKETKDKISKTKKGRLLSEEHKLKVSKSRKGKKFFNDGIKNYLILPSEAEEHFLIGKLKQKNND